MATELPNTQELQAKTSSHSMSELQAALMNAQAEFPVIRKDCTATIASGKGGYTYQYAQLAKIQQAVTPILKKHGLVMSFPLIGNRQQCLLFMPASGEWQLSEWILKLVGTPQQIASEITYAKRYLMNGQLGLIIDDPNEDDDGAAASQPQRQQQRTNNQPPGNRQQSSPKQQQQQQASAKPIDNKAFQKTWLEICSMPHMNLPDGKATQWLSQVLGAIGVKTINDLNDMQREKLLDACMNDGCRSIYEKKKQGNANTTGQSLADVDARRQQRAAG